MKYIFFILSIFFASILFGQKTTISVEKDFGTLSLSKIIFENDTLFKEQLNGNLELISENGAYIDYFRMSIIYKNGKIIDLTNNNKIIELRNIEHLRKVRSSAIVTIYIPDPEKPLDFTKDAISESKAKLKFYLK